MINREHWASLTIESRIANVEAAMRNIAEDGIVPTPSEWNSKRPEWMPKTSAIGNYFAVQFTTMALAFGYRLKPTQHRRGDIEKHCACGMPIETYRLAEVGGYAKDSTHSAVLIPMCSDCADMWDEVES